MLLAPPLPVLAALRRLVRRLGLEERWRDAVQQQVGSEPRGKAKMALSSSYYGRVFDAFDPAWTGLPLEFRHPLMDVRVVELLLGMPAVPGVWTKNCFVRCSQDRFRNRCDSGPRRRCRSTRWCGKYSDGRKPG